jgi:hypothetical protein
VTIKKRETLNHQKTKSNKLARHQPFQIIGYHSCDREVGLKVLNGKDHLIPSNNSWDWLGEGIYFWEQNPYRALEYSVEVAAGMQFNKKRIKTPFVLGAIIQLGNCLNLVESQSLAILEEAYKGLEKLYKATGEKLPINDGNNRKLDCTVIKYVHQSRKQTDELAYDTIRSPFDEGSKVYPGASFTSKNHIQVCVINQSLIKGYFLPTPIHEFNPYLDKEFEK